jgi:hypothetical protein
MNLTKQLLAAVLDTVVLSSFLQKWQNWSNNSQILFPLSWETCIKSPLNFAWIMSKTIRLMWEKKKAQLDIKWFIFAYVLNTYRSDKHVVSYEQVKLESSVQTLSKSVRYCCPISTKTGTDRQMFANSHPLRSFWKSALQLTRSFIGANTDENASISYRQRSKQAQSSNHGSVLPKILA